MSNITLLNAENFVRLLDRKKLLLYEKGVLLDEFKKNIGNTESLKLVLEKLTKNRINLDSVSDSLSEYKKILGSVR
jgi:hypothetical protein